MDLFHDKEMDEFINQGFKKKIEYGVITLMIKNIIYRKI